MFPVVPSSRALQSVLFSPQKGPPSMQYLVIGLSAWTVFEITNATIAITSIRYVTTNRTIDFNSH
jgi:hypothetical protein